MIINVIPSKPYANYSGFFSTPRWSDSTGKYKASEVDYVDEFRSLVKKWRLATLWSSSITEAISHPIFNKITAMGTKVIPLIIEEIERQPDLLIAALPILTGEDPVHDSDRGNFPAMAITWIEWYRNRQ